MVQIKLEECTQNCTRPLSFQTKKSQFSHSCPSWLSYSKGKKEQGFIHFVLCLTLVDYNYGIDLQMLWFNYVARQLNLQDYMSSRKPRTHLISLQVMRLWPNHSGSDQSVVYLSFFIVIV